MPTDPITICPATKPDLPNILEMAHALACHHGDTPALTIETLERDILATPHGSLCWLPAQITP